MPQFLLQFRLCTHILSLFTVILHFFTPVVYMTHSILHHHSVFYETDNGGGCPSLSIYMILNGFSFHDKSFFRSFENNLTNWHYWMIRIQAAKYYKTLYRVFFRYFQLRLFFCFSSFSFSFSYNNNNNNIIIIYLFIIIFLSVFCTCHFFLIYFSTEQKWNMENLRVILRKLCKNTSSFVFLRG